LEDVIKTQKQFYQNLYTNRDKGYDIEDMRAKYIGSYSLKQISDEEKQAKEGLIRYREFLSALRRVKHNKSSGMDGYTTEFYNTIWIDLDHLLLRSINYAYKKNALSVSQQQGIIKCLPKPGTPRNQIQNLRSIYLLNTIYKLASSCIADRIKTTVDDIIHEDQKGFIPGRYIGENT
jgi:hypothetical protein